MTGSGPRRVAVLVDSLLGGGAERVAVEAAAALDPQRWVAHLLVTRTSGPLEEVARELGLELTVLGRRRGFHPRLFLRARRVVRSCDVLHAHKFAGGMWGVLIARAARRPLVVHEHTFDGTDSRVRAWGYRWWIAPTARRVLCVSTPVAEAVVRDGVPARLVDVVPNGVPVGLALPRDEARAELGLAPDATVVGIVGRLRPEKRHELLLEALAELRRGGRDVHLCVVGDGPRRDELRRLAGDLGVDRDVTWAGERPSAARLARAFDVSVLCSSYEGMPLAALETLVAGVPLVATAVGSLAELLADHPDRLVHSGSAQQLAAAIAHTLDTAPPGGDDPAQARARFGLDRLARDLERAYDHAVARR